MLSLNKNSAPGISIAPWFQNGRTQSFTFRVPDRSPEEEAMLEEIRGACPGPLLRGAVDLPISAKPAKRRQEAKRVRENYLAKEILSWSYDEAALYSGLLKRTIQTYASKGYFRTKPHGLYRVDRVEFERFLLNHGKD